MCTGTSANAGIVAENEANPGFLELIFIFREKIKLIWDEIETL